MSKLVISTNGTNQWLERKLKSYAYFSFSNNTVETPLTLNVWSQFATPTGGLLKLIDNASDFEVVGLGIKYIGSDTKVFNLSAVTNIYKAAAGSATRTLELQWKVNGEFAGTPKKCQSNDESNIYSGNGIVPLLTNDILTPWVRNIENSDACRLDNATFTISQEVMYYYE